MSLNFREIDRILQETDLAGYHIQKLDQPSYDTLVIETFGPAGKKNLLISVAPGACRLHLIDKVPARNDRPLRFQECLKSRIKGGIITGARQLGVDRIVKMTILMPEETSTPDAEIQSKPERKGKTSSGKMRAESRSYTLYARLWSGAGNILLVDEWGMVVDALYRKPEKGEASGLPCPFKDPDSGTESAALPERLASMSIRELPGEGSFSSRVAAYYSMVKGELSRDALLQAAAKRSDQRQSQLEERERELRILIDRFGDADRFRQIGDILMGSSAPLPVASAAASPKGRSQGMDTDSTSGQQASAFYEADDFFTGTRISIQVDPGLDRVENAQAYYEKARKAASGLADLHRELEKVNSERQELSEWIKRLEAEKDPFIIAKALEKAGTVRETAVRKYPCISLEKNGWIILVGRTAKENDELLRHHVRGSDLWLHARDHAGSYVFIRARRDKTFPLEIMLDAGCLAAYYSKARKNLEANIYYTQVKYLRRVKDGPKGLVIPTLEKNLFVRFDDERIRQLLSGSQGDDQ